MRAIHRSIPKLVACLVGMTVASAALAQAPRSNVEVIVSKGMPEFRDPKTGQVWTPENVGQGGKPIAPDDKAFDPQAQNVPLQMAIQYVPGRPVGTVPITAGPTVPIVVMDNATLQAVPGKRWQVVLYLDNNSGNAVSPVIECAFTNAGKPVMNTRAMVDPIGPGVRAGLVIYGPRIDVFVDRSSCRVASP
jgi:hypothetical protein